MPSKTIALLIRFLEQGNGQLSKRAREGEFQLLTDEEIAELESHFRRIYLMCN